MSGLYFKINKNIPRLQMRDVFVVDENESKDLIWGNYLMNSIISIIKNSDIVKNL